MSKYAPSIMQTEERCFLCGRNGACDKLDRHEIFGASNRNKSKSLGLWVYLCHSTCHIFGANAAHRNGATQAYLHREGQKAAMERFGWSEDKFRKEFGKSYLEVDDDTKTL